MKKSQSPTANDGVTRERERLEAEITAAAARAAHAEAHGNYASCHHQDLARLKAAWRVMMGLEQSEVTPSELAAVTKPCKKC